MARGGAAPPAKALADWSLAEIHGRVSRLAVETADLIAMATDVKRRYAESRHRLNPQ